MWKVIFWFIVMVAAVAGITWLAEHPGEMTIDWLGWRLEGVPVALVLGVLAVALLLLWAGVRLLRLFIAAPGAARDYFRLRRRRKGLDALSGGLVALMAGDAAAARNAAAKAARLVPEEPVARLLEARAAQDLGEEAMARRIFESMLDDESTEAAALHGLYEQARRRGDVGEARRWATRAWHRHPGLPWAGRALLAFFARDGEWDAVLRLLEEMRRHGLIDKKELARKQAVVLTALARELEEREPDRALDLALRAHKLDPSLIPAAVIAGGMLAARGKLRKAARILERTWKLSPHPDIAAIYAHLRPGDSPRDRLKRVQNLLRVADGGEEGAVALARAAIEAQAWDVARGALRPWLNENPSARIFTLMAELEETAYGDRGRAREWLARAVRARRDPAWTADGIVAPEWLPVSPVSGELGAFEWRTPIRGEDRLAMPEPVPAELLEAPAPAKEIETSVEAAETPVIEATAGGHEEIEKSSAETREEAKAEATGANDKEHAKTESPGEEGSGDNRAEGDEARKAVASEEVTDVQEAQAAQVIDLSSRKGGDDSARGADGDRETAETGEAVAAGADAAGESERAETRSVSSPDASGTGGSRARAAKTDDEGEVAVSDAAGAASAAMESEPPDDGDMSPAGKAETSSRPPSGEEEALSVAEAIAETREDKETYVQPPLPDDPGPPPEKGDDGEQEPAGRRSRWRWFG